jgi:hypothetical protein
MVTRIDVRHTTEMERPEIALDGVLQDQPMGLRFRDVAGMPFTAVYMDDARQYDVEIWVNGTLRHKVPPRSDEVEAIYDLIELSDASEARINVASPSPRFEAEDSPTLDELQQEMSEHPGQVALARWEGLRRSIGVHDRNAHELLGLLDHIASSPDIAVEMFQNTRPPTARFEIEAQIDQRLHNYVASAKSLIDHSRRHFEKYGGSELQQEYEQQRQAITRSPLARFIGDLRNYTLHRELPFVGYTVSFGEKLATAATEIQLAPVELLKWDGWTSLSKAFLTDSSEAISLRTVAADHMQLVHDLYTWVLAQFEGLHRADLVALDEIRSEFNWVLSGGREGRPRLAAWGCRPDTM